MRGMALGVAPIVGLGIATLLVASCGGIARDPRGGEGSLAPGDAGTTTSSGTGGASAGNGGSSGSGSPTASGGTGSASSGGTGNAGASTAGGGPGTRPPPATDGGAPTATDAGAAAGSCGLLPLGFWTRCEETFGPGGDEVFTIRSACAARCLADPRCTSIVDYTWIAPAYGCTTRSSGCTPAADPTSGEDAAREYRKVCGATLPAGASVTLDDATGIAIDSATGCRFESIGDFVACENAVDPKDATATGTSLAECLSLCDGRTDCTAVEDLWTTASMPKCVLHLSTCAAPVSSTSMSRFYAKRCPPEG